MECKVKDLNVFYETRGEGAPVLMLHGWGQNHRAMMYPFEPLFAARTGWKRIYPDLPGHGKTPARDWITDQDKVLEVMLDFIDSVLPGQRFVLVGASAGAYLARGVTLRRSAWMDGLLLILPLMKAADAERLVPPRTVIVQNPALAAELNAEDADMFNNLVVVQDRRMVEAMRAMASLEGEAGDEDFLMRIRMDPVKYSFSFEVDALREPFTAPTLILAGRQDNVVGYRQAWDIVENYPRATFAVLDRAGHGLEIEQEALFHALSGEWLDRVREFIAA
jgi:pimeloyl-ACP methyl ester carboxylesterase